MEKKKERKEILLQINTTKSPPATNEELLKRPTQAGVIPPAVKHVVQSSMARRAGGYLTTDLCSCSAYEGMNE